MHLQMGMNFNNFPILKIQCLKPNSFRMRRVKSIWLITIFILVTQQIFTQTQTTNHSYVDTDGVLRWSKDNSEIRGFGVNYSLPFAHAYRMAKRMNITPEEAIRQDVYHFARLDLDLYRIHVWDTEISDTLGNLIDNDHLRLFDFAINEMKNRGMRFVITPIAFWGNGWPEPDELTPGFSMKYGKGGCLTHAEAIKAQENYLFQFISHINPYTGIAYKDDPDLIAIEISNEPHHKGSESDVTNYINRMVNAIKATGTMAPVFYNMSHSIHLVEAYVNADVVGGTFQWYPTGLGAGRELKGNLLPHVSKYHIPFAHNPQFKKMAKLVYEFDAADAGGNYMYPAMALSFREAGMQLATHFDYDAMFLAPYNTNYGTHYMSLPYAPQKAISLKIASAVFHQIPMNKNYGDYPARNQFGNIRVDYERNLAELVSDTRFFYTNNTGSQPVLTNKLKEIAGYGNSPLVRYDGTGAYFLDEVEKGVWRLEIMPDVYWIGDPYARISPERQIAAVHHTLRTMKINLPALGRNFLVRGINADNNYNTKSEDGVFKIEPGVYLLYNEKIKPKVNASAKYKNIKIGEFVAPESNLNRVVVNNLSPEMFTALEPAKIEFELFSAQEPVKIELLFQGSVGFKRLLAEKTGVNTYSVILSDVDTKAGMSEFFIMPEFENGVQTFPAGLKGRPYDWDFVNRTGYSIKFIAEDKPILIWSAAQNWNQTLKPWTRFINIEPSFRKGSDILLYDLNNVPKSQDGVDSLKIHTFKFYFADLVKGRLKAFATKNEIVIDARSLNNNYPELEIGISDTDGRVFSGKIRVNNVDQLYRIPISALQPGKFVIMPRPYPEFKPYFGEFPNNHSFNILKAETLQVSLVNAQVGERVQFYIREIRME